LRFTLLIISLFFISISTIGQINASFDYFKTDSIASKKYSSLFISNSDSVCKSIKGNKEYKSFCKNRKEIIEWSFLENEYLFDDKIYPKLNEIFNEIKSNNPEYQFPEITQVLVGNSVVPNAYCYGNGVLVFNLGLLNRLYTEDQVAFVIAHEMAHQALDHVDSRIKKVIAFNNSRDHKKAISDIKKMDYENQEAYDNYKLNTTMNFRKQGRSREIEADSLGIKLLINTKYNEEEGLAALDILDEVDQEKYKDSIDFIKVLSSDKYKFNTDLLKKRGGLDVEQEFDKEIADALKTHPDCKDRISFLKNEFQLTESINGEYIELPLFFEMIDFKLIQVDYLNHRYGRALKNTMLLEKYYPNDSLLKTMNAILLAEIYLAQLDHRIREVVPAPSDDYDFNYHRVLLIISNIRLSELKEMYNGYMVTNQYKMHNNSEHKLYLKYLDSKLNNKANSEELKLKYLKDYQNGMYRNSIN